MHKWSELMEARALGRQHWFHLVCFTELKEELEMIKGKFFSGFKVGEQEQIVNSIVTVMSPFLGHHQNIGKSEWILDLKAGNSAPLPTKDNEEDKRAVVMESELWVPLDYGNYKMLKKFHEGCDTFSMAMVLRSLLVLAFRLIASLGCDGFLLWVKEWLEKYEKEDAPKFKEAWKELEKHIELFEARNVKYIGLYSAWHHQIHFYHPPPGR